MTVRKQDKIRHAIVWLGIVPLALAAPLAAQKDSCVDCHAGLEAELKAPVDGFAADVHKQFGLGCASCHGGNPAQDDVTLAKDKTFRGSPKRAEIPEFCGTCHANSAFMRQYNPNLRVDQLDLFWTSRHGKLVKSGDAAAAVCTSCHGVHGIQTANFPKSATFAWNIPETCGRCHSDAALMKPYGIPVDQAAEYRQSIHAAALYDKKDLSAPVCNDCHGNHGAAPPEVKAVAYVCRQCHPSAGDLFSAGPHKAAFDAMESSECEACHGNHKIVKPSDAMLAGGNNDVCVQCHDTGDKGYQAGLEMRRKLEAYVASYAHNETLLDQADNKGVEVSEARFRLQEANSALIEVRNLTHGLALPAIETRLGEGGKVLEEVRGLGEAALHEATFRKTGLVVATFFILLLALALYFKVRDLNSGDTNHN
jgi:predicted CXXCH cytochrome family protein